MADKDGRALANQAHDKFMKQGGTIVGNIFALNSYKFKKVDEDHYTVEDDCYLNYKKDYKEDYKEDTFPMEPMTMSNWCFNKYFVIIEDDGKEESE